MSLSKAKSDHGNLEFEQKALRRDSVNVLWHLPVEQAESALDLLLGALIEIDQARRQGHFGVASGQGQKAHPGGVLEEPLLFLVLVSLVAVEHSALGQVKGQTRQAFEVMERTLAEEELDRVSLSCDEQMHLEAVK